jgi:hypothetical protein
MKAPLEKDMKAWDLILRACVLTIKETAMLFRLSKSFTSDKALPALVSTLQYLRPRNKAVSLSVGASKLLKVLQETSMLEMVRQCEGLMNYMLCNILFLLQYFSCCVLSSISFIYDLRTL